MIEARLSTFFLISLFLWLGGLDSYDASGQKAPIPTHALRFEHITVDDGLPSDWIRQIVQDEMGFIWLATASGLVKYDGYTFKLYHHDLVDPNALKDTDIKAVHEDSKGSLWVAYFRGGLSRYNRATDTFVNYAPLGDELISEWVIATDNRGGLWFSATTGDRSASQGLILFDFDSNAFENYTWNENKAFQSVVVSVLYSAPSTPDLLWLGSEQGLYTFDIVTKTYTRYDIDVEGVGALLEPASDPGFLWIGTKNGVVRLNLETGEEEQYFLDVDSSVHGIVEDHEGMLWLGMYEGPLFYLNPTDGSYERILLDSYGTGYADGVPFPAWLTELFIDREGNIWTSRFFKGIYKLNPQKASIPHYHGDPRSPLDASNYGRAHANIHEDSNGTIWVAESELFGIRGLPFDSSSGNAWPSFLDAEVLEVKDELRRCTEPFVYFIRTFPSDPDIVWFGGSKGICTLDIQSGKVTRYWEDPVVSIAETFDGNVWVGTNLDGILRLDKETKAVKQYPYDPRNPHSIAGEWVWDVLVDRSGALWAATSRGVSLYNPSTDAFMTYEVDENYRVNNMFESAMSLYEDRAGRLWLGSSSGLTLIDRERGLSKTYTPTNSDLLHNRVAGFAEDQNGNLWMGHFGGSGITRFNPQTESFRHFGVEDGLQFGGVWKIKTGKKGNLLVAGSFGWTSFFPEQLEDNPVTPKVWITSVLVNGEESDVDEWIEEQGRVGTPENLKLNHDRNDLSIEYVGLHFEAPELNRYRYMLEGYDDTWRGITAERTADYTNLPFGDYTFRVIAANGDGVWNEAGASMAITIMRPWWRTWWAYIFYSLFLISGIVAADRFQRRRLIATERLRAEREKAKAIESTNTELERALKHLTETQDQLIHTEKMASLGQLTAGVAHEIKNPLNFVNNFAQICVGQAEDLEEVLEKYQGKLETDDAHEIKSLLDDLKVNASKINEHGHRADGIIRSMLEHSRAEPGQKRPTDINKLLDEFVNLAYHGVKARVDGDEVTIQRHYDESLPEILVVPQEIGRVFINILDNAFYAVNEKAKSLNGLYKPRVTVTTQRKDQDLEICIEDNGTGIPSKIKGKIFEPFFTTKPTGSGTGLGLSLSYDIVTQGHGGTLRVESTEGEGATFIITLPAV